MLRLQERKDADGRAFSAFAAKELQEVEGRRTPGQTGVELPLDDGGILP